MTALPPFVRNALGSYPDETLLAELAARRGGATTDETPRERLAQALADLRPTGDKTDKVCLCHDCAYRDAEDVLSALETAGWYLEPAAPSPSEETP